MHKPINAKTKSDNEQKNTLAYKKMKILIEVKNRSEKQTKNNNRRKYFF
jgi:hypothetical protein